jgi:hypothetical protein
VTTRQKYLNLFSFSKYISCENGKSIVQKACLLPMKMAACALVDGTKIRGKFGVFLQRVSQEKLRKQ